MSHGRCSCRTVQFSQGQGTWETEVLFRFNIHRGTLTKNTLEGVLQLDENVILWRGGENTNVMMQFHIRSHVLVNVHYWLSIVFQRNRKHWMKGRNEKTGSKERIQCGDQIQIHWRIGTIGVMDRLLNVKCSCATCSLVCCCECNKYSITTIRATLLHIKN